MKQLLYVGGELPTLNEITKANRTNKFVGANLKKTYTNLVAWECKKQGVKAFNKKINVEIIWHCRNKRKDKDNIMAGQKFIFDGLQLAKVIRNDGWAEIGDISHKFIIDDEYLGAEVIMEEI